MTHTIRDATGRTVSRTAKTAQQYNRRFDQLINRSVSIQGCEKDAVTYDMVLADTISTSHSYAKRTVTYDRAVLLYIAETMRLKGRWTADECERVRFQLETISYSVNPPARTSAKKAKKISSENLQSLLIALRKSKTSDHELLLGLVFFGLCFPMRPIEWRSAKFHKDRLIVANAKFTNGRSHSASREFPLEKFAAGELAVLENLICWVQSLDSDDEWKKHLKRLLSKLHTICKNLGFPGVSFASLRGVAIATLKRSAGAVEAGYFAGHVSDRMSQTAYPRSNSAPKGLKPRISASDAQKSMVQVSGRSAPKRSQNVGHKLK